MSDAREVDPWGTESGLLTNYEGVIVDAFFGKDPDYNPDTRMLFFKLATDSPEKPEHEERYNLPPGWETWDGGQTVENRERGDAARFNANSAVGKLLAAITKECPEALDVLRDRGTQRDAAVWIGMKFFWEETSTPYKFKARVDGPKGKKGEWIEGTTVKNFPTKFLGTVEVEAGGTATTTTDTVADTATGAPAVPVGSSAMSDGDRTTIKLLAKTKPTHPEWVEAVMEHEGGKFLSDSELVAALSDDSPQGLWATLRSE